MWGGGGPSLLVRPTFSLRLRVAASTHLRSCRVCMCMCMCACGCMSVCACVCMCGSQQGVRLQAVRGQRCRGRYANARRSSHIPVCRAPGSRPFLPPRACVCLALPNTEASGDADGLRRLALWKVQSRYVQERNETAINRLDLLRYVGAQLPFKSRATVLLLYLIACLEIVFLPGWVLTSLGAAD